MNARCGLLWVMVLVGCASTPRPPAKDDSLYRALGGQEGIATIVEELLVRSVENPRIGHHFAETDLVQLHERLSQQICVEAGGPCVYEGLTMEEAHTGMDISEADFNALVEDLQDAMEALEIPVAAQNRLLRRLAPMRPEVIHR